MVRRGASGHTRFLEGILLALIVTAMPLSAVGQAEPFPLEPPDTTSPRGTLFNLSPPDRMNEPKRLTGTPRPRTYT